MHQLTTTIAWFSTSPLKLILGSSNAWIQRKGKAGSYLIGKDFIGTLLVRFIDEITRKTIFIDLKALFRKDFFKPIYNTKKTSRIDLKDSIFLHVNKLYMLIIWRLATHIKIKSKIRMKTDFKQNFSIPVPVFSVLEERGVHTKFVILG